MSEVINSIEDLKKTESEEATVDTPKKVDPRQAAIERLEEKQKAEEQSKIDEKNKRREIESREYEYEVNGFNIGDSIMRRKKQIDVTAHALKEKLDEEKAMEDLNNNEVSDEVVEKPEENFEEDGSLDINTDEEVHDINEEFLFDMDNKGHNPVEREDPIEPVNAEEDTDEDENKKEEQTAGQLAAYDPIKSEHIASQDEMNIDEKDFDDIDLDDEIEISEEEEEEDDDDDELSEAELEGLKKAIKEKINYTLKKDKTGNVSVTNKVVSLSAVLAQQEASVRTADFPLMSAGHNVTMKMFSATEIDSLNRGASGRNKFNVLKEIYHTIYSHIVNEKRDFETWLKTTSFMDIDSYYMAAYKASFEGANYIPYSCEKDDDGCGHVFLSDNVPFDDMIKFKDDETKKRFYNIYNSVDINSEEQKGLYNTKIVPVSDIIAIGFREPTIYNTIFENSVLDQKFIDKYASLLTTLVYIDKIYLITPDGYAPVGVKTDPNSIAKSTKYRIATLSKIIKSLSSDSYNIVISEIAKIADLGNGLSYQIPEMECPKCGHKIPALEQKAVQLFFSRHRLNLLSQE